MHQIVVDFFHADPEEIGHGAVHLPVVRHTVVENSIPMSLQCRVGQYRKMVMDGDVHPDMRAVCHSDSEENVNFGQ